MAVAQAQAESPGLSRFVLPILGLIGLGLCGARHPRPVRPAGRAEPPGLDLRRHRQHVRRDRPAQRSGRSGDRQAPARGDRPAGRRRRHLAAVPRRRQRWSACSRRNGATGSCRGSSSAPPWCCWRSSWSTPRRERSCAASRTTQGQFTLANYAVMVEPEFTADPAQQRHLADRRHRRQRGPRTHLRRAVRSRPARVAGQDHRLPAAGDLARRRIGHLGLRLRLAARRPAADRTPERRRGRPRRQADPVADDQPDQHLLRDRDPGLAPDRVRDGRLLGVDQGRARARSSRRPGSTAPPSASSSSG